jgi:hypothetical protein
MRQAALHFLKPRSDTLCEAALRFATLRQAATQRNGASRCATLCHAAPRRARLPRAVPLCAMDRYGGAVRSCVIGLNILILTFS